MLNKWLVLLVVSVVLIGCLHAFTPGSLHFYHDTFRRLSYFPITIAAILFGVRGGVFIAGLTSIAFIPHLLLFLGDSPETYLSELTEIILYLLAGLVIGIIASKEKVLREKYQALSEKLEKSYHRLQKETELLIDAEEQLRSSQKISAIGKLSAALVHEIKNPLASIRGAAEIVLDDYQKDNKKRKFPEIIIKETHRLDQTVSEVLSFAKPAPVKHEDNYSIFDNVVSHVSTLVGTELNKRKIKLEIDANAAAKKFIVDGGRLSQVIMNIILNASEVIENEGEIILTAIIEKKNLKIEINDDGPGVPGSIKEKIFTPFFTGREGGNGLGLSISRKIIESFGGQLSLNENYKDGAGFIITLPDIKGIDVFEGKI